MNIIAIIPARGGSKEVLGKNIREFNGKPLITHSIEYAKSCDLVNSVYVSTDDERISVISSDSGAKIIDRPSNISGDTATTESAIEHALSTLKITPNIIVLLQATSPLRPLNSLHSAINKFINGGFDSLLSISPTHRFFWKIENDGTAQAEYDFMNRPRRQDMTKDDISYIENGSVYIFTREHFENIGNRLGGKIGYIEFPEEYSYEIDIESDFIFLENLLKTQ
mgnify:CR=1 FL=1